MQAQWISRDRDIERLAARCREVGSLALDTEADSMHAYFHKTCLIQVTVAQETAIIDPLALTGAELSPLFDVLGDSSVSVLMHGSDYDMRVLDRDFGAHVSGLEDTQEMALILGEAKTGLAALLEREFGIVLDKKYQRADWGRRPLTQEMIEYAAADTRHLAALVATLRRRLEELGRWTWAEEEFRRLEQVRYCEKAPDPWAFERIKGSALLRGLARDRLFSLHQWREKKAQRRNVPPFKVLGNHSLVALAGLEGEPGLVALEALPGISARLVHRIGRELVAILKEPASAPPRRPGRRGPELSSPQRKMIKALSAQRDRIAGSLGIQEGLCCPKALIQDISLSEEIPRSRGDLETLGLKGWRLQELGAAFLEVLAEIDP